MKTIFREHNWLNKKIYLGPEIVDNDNSESVNLTNLFAFFIILPFLYLKSLVVLAYYKYFKKTRIIICGSWNEKLVITLVARILNIKTVWLECPPINYQGLNRLFLWLYRQNGKLATIICFTNGAKIKLNNIGCGHNKDIKVINPGIKLGFHHRQETIFDTLAQSDYRKSGRKFFTLGTMVTLNKQQKLKTLFQATKKSLTVIPNLQLIIVGSGNEKKNLMWLIKKMEIDSLVWFVGEQGHTRKWLDSFDVFVITTDLPKLYDIKIMLQAMAVGLPIIAPSNTGLDDFIQENKTGLLYEVNNSEMLARRIINLEQNSRSRTQLGKNARDRVDKLFNIDTMVKQFENILNL